MSYYEFILILVLVTGYDCCHKKEITALLPNVSGYSCLSVKKPPPYRGSSLYIFIIADTVCFCEFLQTPISAG